MQRLKAILRVLFPLVLSLVPGWGHIWLRRYHRGLALFFLCFLTLNLLAVFYLINQKIFKKIDDEVISICVAILAFSIVDVLRITVWLQSRTVKNRQSMLYRKAMTHYLRSEYAQARDAVKRMLRTAPIDIRARLLLGMIQRESGERKRAIKTLKSARRMELAGDWLVDVERELEVTRSGGFSGKMGEDLS